ncbi:MAG: HAD family phosphatase [Deltaproteobacteria bacterium]|nr:HAD family phosphatase [Deltaproteobacteria bacterium]
MTIVKAVLFDFDGVLADTMEYNYQAWYGAFKKYGISLQREDYFPLEGVQLDEIVRIITTKYGISNIDSSDVILTKEALFKKDFKFNNYPGVVPLITALKRSRIQMAIVSAGSRQRLFDTTPHQFLNMFDVIVTGDKVERGKPYPDPYLKAMRELSILPHESIVVENALIGIQAAKSAGALCIAIASTQDKSFLKEADFIIDRFSDLATLEIIQNLIT